MYTDLANYSLKTMGVVVWQQQHPLPGALPSIDFTSYALQNSSGEQVGVVCLESRTMTSSQETAVLQLLDAMLAAVQLKRSVNHVSGTDALALVMGVKLVQQVLHSTSTLDELRVDNIRVLPNRTKLLVTYHPLDLLNQRELKAKAWEDLKKLQAK